VAVETALILPLCLMMLYGILEVGRAWFTYNLLTHAVREGTRLAVVTPALQTDDEAVLSRMDGLLNTGGLVATRRSVQLNALQGGVRMVRVAAGVQFVPLVEMVWSKRGGFQIPLRVEMESVYEA